MTLKIDPEQKVNIKVGNSRVTFKLKNILAPPGKKISLKKDFDPDFTGGYHDKEAALAHVASNVERLQELQEKLYAQDKYALLIIFQAMDAAGKDGAIKHVMSGVNPQGCHVSSFKKPSAEELDHDYLWRGNKALPRRGMIGIFNRSYYEEVLVVRVHQEILKSQKLPPEAMGKDIWKDRFKDINNFEKYLVRNGIFVLKFFLNVSKKEQCKRFLDRIEKPEKNWKFSVSDFEERAYWDDYQAAYQDLLRQTSTDWAPWFVIPADNKWFSRLAVSQAVCAFLDRLDLKFPKVSKARRQELLEIKELLESDK